MQDPEQKTEFHNKVAMKLLEFTEALERDNYMQAVSREYFINYEDLKRLVNRLGNQPGLIRAEQEETKRGEEGRKGKKRMESENPSAFS